MVMEEFWESFTAHWGLLTVVLKSHHSISVELNSWLKVQHVNLMVPDEDGEQKHGL